jgi:hypothetical protein
MNKNKLIISTLLFIFCITGKINAQDKLTDSIQHYQELAKQARTQNNTVDYLRYTKKVVELAPEDYLARYILARAFVMNKKPGKAINALSFLADRNSDLIVFIENDPILKALCNHPKYMPIKDATIKKSNSIVKSSPAFSLKEKDLIPEGITFDPVGHKFYIGSFHKGKIVSVDQNGFISDFAKKGQDGLMPVLGMKVDAKKRILWVVNSFGRANSSISQEHYGKSGVFKYDLETGLLIKKYMLPQEEGHFLNDLALHPNGDVYLTDSNIPAVYKIEKHADTLEKFVALEGFPNGIELSPKKNRLFVASSGIYSIELSDKTVEKLKQPPELLISADGMYYYDQSLLIIQNSSLDRILRLHLNEEESEIINYELLESNNPIFDIPTTGVICEKDFYFIANSQVTAYDESGNLHSLDKLNETQIRRIGLE